MVSTRSHDNDPETGDKRPAASQGGSPKRHKVEKKVVSKHRDEGDETPEVKDEEQEQKPLTGDDPKEEKDGKGDEAKEGAESSEDKKPDGMDEGKRDVKPKGPVEEHKAGQGELLEHLPEVDADRKHGVIEKGYIYFTYRPKVETEHPESLDDVAKFHLLLSPEGQGIHRLITVGKKALPDASESTRPIWGQVLNVADDLKQFKDGLGAYTYETKTRGTRHQPGARVAAAGAYVLHTTEHPPEHSANASAVYQTHLAYEIAVPHEEGLHIQHEGVFTLQVKNPDSASTNPAVRNQPASKHPQFPPELKHLFTTKFIPANPSSLLNYPGAELLLLPSKHTAEQEIGASAEKELEAEEKDLEKEIEKQKNGNEAKKVLKEMGMEGLARAEALEGHWE
ncbi:hypothetical protein JCM10450v2_004976 [Rhodotorula kratochvilovae]